MWFAVLLLFVNDIDRSVVRRVIRTHRDEIERCYAAALKTHPHLDGRLVVRFSIDGKGEVTDASIVESDMPAPELEQFIVAEFRKMKFPPFGRGEPVTITYPFRFEAGNWHQSVWGHPDANFEQLMPSQIQRGMEQIKPLVAACYAQYNAPGVVTVTMTINPSGRVARAVATGAFAGTPTGDCVAAAVKRAMLPRFKGPAMSGIDYPFKLGAPPAR